MSNLPGLSAETEDRIVKLAYEKFGIVADDTEIRDFLRHVQPMLVSTIKVRQPLIDKAAERSNTNEVTLGDQLKVDGKLRLRDLSGPLLNYWVAKANEPWFPGHQKIKVIVNIFGEIITRIGSDEDGWTFWSPSTSWMQGGPIIDREGISTKCAEDRSWFAYSEFFNETGAGRSALDAAMRAYVASKYGIQADFSFPISGA